MVFSVQCFVALVMVETTKAFGFISYPPFNWETARSWLPLNLLFVGMLFTGFLSLVYASVPMVTIFKNLTNAITVFGDNYFFGEQ